MIQQQPCVDVILRPQAATRNPGAKYWIPAFAGMTKTHARHSGRAAHDPDSRSILFLPPRLARRAMRDSG